MKNSDAMRNHEFLHFGALCRIEMFRVEIQSVGRNRDTRRCLIMRRPHPRRLTERDGEALELVLRWRWQWFVHYYCQTQNVTASNHAKPTIRLLIEWPSRSKNHTKKMGIRNITNPKIGDTGREGFSVMIASKAILKCTGTAF